MLILAWWWWLSVFHLGQRACIRTWVNVITNIGEERSEAWSGNGKNKKKDELWGSEEEDS